MSGERSEQATPRRLEQARQKGDIPRSRELTAAVAMVAGALLLRTTASRFAAGWAGTTADLLALGRPERWEPGAAAGTLLALRSTLLFALAPVGLIFLAAPTATLLVTVAQNGGLRVNPEAIAPRAGRINPGANLKQVFSARSLVRLGKSMLPAAVLLLVAALELHRLWAMPPFSLARFNAAAASLARLLLWSGGLMLAWSGVDYLAERHSWRSRLRMSKDEVRREYRESEGDPHTKSRIRAIQRQMRKARLRADVRSATVVVTNPTHFAVALSFDYATMEPPRVLAKGRDRLAAEIRDEARWAGVPLVENPPLARSLYRLVEPGQSIPRDLYAAVAAILAYLYRQRQREQAAREEAAAGRRARGPREPGQAGQPGRPGQPGETGSASAGRTGNEPRPGAAARRPEWVDPSQPPRAGAREIGPGGSR